MKIRDMNEIHNTVAKMTFEQGSAMALIFRDAKLPTVQLEAIHEILKDCFFQQGEDTSTAVIVTGFTTKFGFHPERLMAHKDEIFALINKHTVAIEALEAMMSLGIGIGKLEGRT